MAYAASNGLYGHHRALVIGELGVINDFCRLGSDSVNSKGLIDWVSIKESLYSVRQHWSDLRPKFL